ncbi:MAG: RHS repeat-associated core domain-containing protein [Cyanobacteria bacterium P01_A01_bin.37]
MIVEVELVLGKACKARKVAEADAFPTACKSAPSADDNPTDAYDYQGRLVDKDDGTDVEVYVYDGWTEHGSAEMVQAIPAPEGLRQRVPSGQRRNNRIASLDPQTSPFTLQTSLLWGMDLSGTMQGAGGVGGLLKEGSSYMLYDANGNIMQKLNTSGVTTMAVEYDPFGNVISGTLVGEYGFSTKPLVEDVDWYYYGFRYYDPVTGRWPSRDPIQEDGGLNLYGFVGNDAANAWDYLGQDFIAVGDRPVDGAHGLPGFWHMSIDFFTESSPYCTNQGHRFFRSASGGRNRRRGIPSSASHSESVELLNTTGEFGRRRGKRNLWSTVSVSRIEYDNLRAQDWIVIYSDADNGSGSAANAWQRILNEAASYQYAEHNLLPVTLASTLSNWPNFKYGYSGNNSNTFAREMARVVGGNADDIPRQHIGAQSPSPVTDRGPTPINRFLR